MPKNYAYRMRCDRGFAPNIECGICTLTGCKRITVEIWAKEGSWVIGIGGNDTGKPDKLIYAMEVKENLLCSDFIKKYPKKSQYLKGENPGTNVLVSDKFYYFGENAIELPGHLKHIIIKGPGCKCISDEDIKKLENYIAKDYEIFETPCNDKKLDCNCKKSNRKDLFDKCGK